jgi:hypothetical protein
MKKIISIIPKKHLCTWEEDGVGERCTDAEYLMISKLDDGGFAVDSLLDADISFTESETEDDICTYTPYSGVLTIDYFNTFCNTAEGRIIQINDTETEHITGTIGEIMTVCLHVKRSGVRLASDLLEAFKVLYSDLGDIINQQQQ